MLSISDANQGALYKLERERYA